MWRRGRRFAVQRGVRRHASAPRGRGGRGAVLVLAVWATISVTLGGAQAETLATESLAGKPLEQALRQLRSAGLNVIYTSNVVRPEMLVERSPTSETPHELLAEILAPHGLELLDGPNGALVVVPQLAGPPQATLVIGRSSILGTVRSHRDATAIPGVTLRLVEAGLATTSNLDGSFLIPDAPAGLHTLEVRRRGFVVESLSGVQLEAGRATRLAVLLDPAPITADTLVVTPSWLSLLRREPVTPLALSRDEIFALPHLGGDPFRAISLLPGVAANDVSARFHVRGGRRDETRVLIDGQELYDSYHLEDFDSALSVVAANTLEHVDLSTGGFPVDHGDRMSGVLDMTTVTPGGPRRTTVGIGVLSAHLGSSGSFGKQRGSWLAHLRRGSIDLASRLLGKEKPRFWDGFAKLDYQLSRHQGLRGNFLHTDDELEFSEVVGTESKQIETGYQSTYLWLTHQAILGANLLVESAVSRARVDRLRRAVELEEDARFRIVDRREFEVIGLRQAWSLQISPNHSLKWGFERRDFETAYDYRGSREFDNPLALLRDNQEPTTLFSRRLTEGHDSAYLAARTRQGEALTLELGLRWDKHSLTRESRLSPRFNLAWALGERSVLRAAWGRFNQSQRPWELQVEDGETDFNPVERSDSRVLGYERRLAGHRLTALRVELYQRQINNPLPRWENLYEPLNVFPEVEPDRVRIAPDRAHSAGVEIFLRGRCGRKLGWWLNYSWSSATDEIAGTDFERSFDQPHALNLDLDFPLGEQWTLNLAWRFHTGWPTTPLALRESVDEDGETVFVPVPGARFSARLPDYHRLDLRASRSWQLQSGTLGLFFDVQNVYDRGNVAGFDFDIDEENGTLTPDPEEWAGILPSMGLTFEF
jgi:outer membrane receptor protein involved in Fe transport